MNTFSLPPSAVTTFFIRQRFPTPSSPNCPSMLPLCLTMAKARGVKFDSWMTVSQAQAYRNLHGCSHVLAQLSFSDISTPVHTHKHIRAYAHIPLRGPSASNLALNVTNGVRCETVGIQARRGEGQRRGLCDGVRWTEGSRGKKRLINFKTATEIKDTMHALKGSQGSVGCSQAPVRFPFSLDGGFYPVFLQNNTTVIQYCSALWENVHRPVKKYNCQALTVTKLQYRVKFNDLKFFGTQMFQSCHRGATNCCFFSLLIS